MTLEEAKVFFSKDVYAVETSKLQIVEVAPNYSKVQMKIERCHQNALGYVMGGAYFTAADFAFAVATNDPAHTTVTTSSTINYLRACNGKELIAEAKLLKEGKNTCFYVINITDENGNLIAVVNTTGNHIYKK